MYFPQIPIDIRGFLRNIDSYSDKLYIFILSHPQNNSNEMAEILSRVNYLDKMTRDVTFVMPGYKRQATQMKSVTLQTIIYNLHLMKMFLLT